MVNLSYIGFGEDKLPTSLLDSLLTLAAPYVPLDGLNEKGLAVGVLLIDTEPTDQQTDKPDITPPPPSACCWIGRPPWMRRWHC